MITRVLQVDPEQPDDWAIKEAAAVLKSGGLVAFATETVYGLGAIATNPSAVAKIFQAKGRPAFNPVIVHVAGPHAARACASTWPISADRLVLAFWPGPLTIVVKRAPEIPDEVTAGGSTVGVRIPNTAVALALLERTAEPIAAPSANRSNGVSPTTAEHVLASLDGRIELVLDSGPTTVGLESTVLDLSAEPPRLLRPGPISVAQLEVVLECAISMPETPGASSDRPSSPGQLAVHYAPRTPAFRVDSISELLQVQNLDRSAIIQIGIHAESPTDSKAHTVLLENPGDATRNLYGALHRCDALSLSAIIVIMPPDRPEWLAVRDRILRATRPLLSHG